MSKNIEMNIKTEQGYEIVYPKTITNNIIDIQNNYYNKNEIITLETLQKYGLTDSNTPNDVFLLLSEKTKQWKIIQQYTTAGAYTFQWPSEDINEIIVYIIGAGGGGSVLNSNSYSANYILYGGDCGGLNIFYTNKKQNYSLIVGAGGVGKKITVTSNNQVYEGQRGQDSSFNGVVALGGKSGRNDENFIHQPAYGTKDRTNRIGFGINDILYGLNDIIIRDTLNVDSKVKIANLDNKYLFLGGELLTPFYKDKLSMFARGGTAYLLKEKVYYESNVDLPNNKKGSPGYAKEASGGEVLTVEKGTDYGCGGGSIIAYTGTQSVTMNAADGCDGAILIYGK